MVLTLAQIPGWLISLLAVFFLVVCLALILIVLIQRPQGGGLSGAFGAGAGSGQTAFGTKTGDVLTLVTIAIFILFLGTAIGLNFAVRPPAAGPRPQQAAPATPVDEEGADVDESLEGEVPPADLRGEEALEGVVEETPETPVEPPEAPPPPAEQPPVEEPAAPPPGGTP